MHSGPRLLYFNVSGRRELARRAATAAPGVRWSYRRSWRDDPGEPRRGIFGGAPAVGLWYWAGGADELAAQAGERSSAAASWIRRLRAARTSASKANPMQNGSSRATRG